jgi:hypothetical protein
VDLGALPEERGDGRRRPLRLALAVDFERMAVARDLLAAVAERPGDLDARGRDALAGPDLADIRSELAARLDLALEVERGAVRLVAQDDAGVRTLAAGATTGAPAATDQPLTAASAKCVLTRALDRLMGELDALLALPDLGRRGRYTGSGMADALLADRTFEPQ